MATTNGLFLNELTKCGLHADQMRDYIKNKEVVLVGPAPYLCTEASTQIVIDTTDVVVRFNNGNNLCEANPSSYGTKTDILYINQSLRDHSMDSTAIPEAWSKNGVKFIVFEWDEARDILKQQEDKFTCAICRKPYQRTDMVSGIEYIDHNKGGEKRPALAHQQCIVSHIPAYQNSELLYPDIIFVHTSRWRYKKAIKHTVSSDETMDDINDRPFTLLLGMNALFDMYTCNARSIRLTGFDFYSGFFANQKKRNHAYAPGYATWEGEITEQHKDKNGWQKKLLKMFYNQIHDVDSTKQTTKLYLDHHLQSLLFSHEENQKILRNKIRQLHERRMNRN